jgi:hypothetical protein
MPKKEINAFRILLEAGHAYFLDFIHYSAADQQAEVVSRLRVHEDVMVSIKDCLARDLCEVPVGIALSWPAPAGQMVN